MVKVNSCVFISGSGTNLNKLLISSNTYTFPLNIKLVISNNESALGLKIAKKFSIPYLVFDHKSNLFEEKIIITLKKKKIDLILLAGYMRVLSKKFINSFGKKIINIHPSLLPKFKGLNTYKNIILAKEKKTGCTVHFVNEKLDDGKIILKKSFYIKNSDSIDILKKKTQKLEYKAYSEAIIKLYNKS